MVIKAQLVILLVVVIGLAGRLLISGVGIEVHHRPRMGLGLD